MLEKNTREKKKKKSLKKISTPRRQLPPSYCFTPIQLGLLFENNLVHCVRKRENATHAIPRQSNSRQFIFRLLLELQSSAMRHEMKTCNPRAPSMNFLLLSSDLVWCGYKEMCELVGFGGCVGLWACSFFFFSKINLYLK